MQQTRRLILNGLTRSLATPAIARTSACLKFQNTHVDETCHIIWHQDVSPLTPCNELHSTHKGRPGFYSPNDENSLDIDTATQKRWSDPRTTRTAASPPTSKALPSLLNTDTFVFWRTL